MNVALFASAFYPHIGGVEELVRQLAHEQKRQGINPLILTMRWPKDLPATEEFEGLSVRRHLFRVPDFSWKQRCAAHLLRPTILKQVCADVQKHSTDVLHVQCVSVNAHYALQAKRRLRLPLVVTLQGELTMDATGVFQRSHFAQGLMRSVLSEADAITACSQQTLSEAEEFFGQSFGKRGRVIYNGIRLEDFRNAVPHSHPRPYILGIGRHVPQKGFDLLLRAFAQIVQAGEKTYDLLLAGDGRDRKALEELAATLGLTGRVHFIGRVDRANAVRLFAGCAFFVLPSRHEPFGIVNLEAMAAGKAVVAARVGGVPEIVEDGKTGLLFPGENIEALRDTLLRLMDDVALQTRLGAAGAAYVRRFDWTAVTEQYSQVYQEVAKTR